MRSSLRAPAALVLLFVAFAPFAAAREEIDYSQYDVPVFEQITNHIKAKVAARLQDGQEKSHDRYFIIPFAYENKGHDPELSHSFISVVRVFGQGAEPSPTPGLTARSYKNRQFEAFTISWLPDDFAEHPHLCVFDGFGARLIPSANKCPLSTGKSFTLPETIKLAVDEKLAIGMWGPFEITKPAFELGVKRLRLLETGTIKYRADDRMYRKDRVAINCFHAMADIYELFPNGGLFGTGLMMWGLHGTRRVLIEYNAKAAKMDFLLEPISVKKDIYGFVYAPEQNARRVYNPFEHASAYWK